MPPRGPSLAARREAVRKALTIATGMSDRVIASWCGVSREMVKETRRRLEEAGVILDQFERIGGDGKAYRVEAFYPERTP